MEHIAALRETVVPNALVPGAVTEIEFDFADERVQIAWPKVRLKHVQQPPPSLPVLNEGDFSAR
jgi:hypothetical protein